MNFFQFTNSQDNNFNSLFKYLGINKIKKNITWNRLKQDEKNVINLIDNNEYFFDSRDHCEYYFNSSDHIKYKNSELRVIFVINHNRLGKYQLRSKIIETRPAMTNPFFDKPITLKVKNYAGRIRANLKFEQKVLIALISCSAGRESYFGKRSIAYELAKELNLPIIAADEIIEYRAIPWSTVSPFDNKIISRNVFCIKEIRTKGNWKIFYPDRKVGSIITGTRL